MSFFNFQIVGNLFFSKASIDGLLRFADTIAMFLQGLEEMTGDFFFFKVLNEFFRNRSNFIN
ncbi:Uncharacterised protein [Mycobacterium tuberculosis]|nr:Uncharacterised protein [Mycobacterium tuberculosis]